MTPETNLHIHVFGPMYSDALKQNMCLILCILFFTDETNSGNSDIIIQLRPHHLVIYQMYNYCARQI